MEPDTQNYRRHGCLDVRFLLSRQPHSKHTALRFLSVVRVSTRAARSGIGSVDATKELIPVRDGYNSEASCLQSMPQGLALFEARPGYRLPHIKKKNQKTQCAPHRSRMTVRHLGNSRVMSRLLVLGAYTIMLTSVVARACKRLYVSDGSLGSSELQQIFQSVCERAPGSSPLWSYWQ